MGGDGSQGLLPSKYPGLLPGNLFSIVEDICRESIWAFRSVRDLGRILVGCSYTSGISQGRSPGWLPAWLPTGDGLADRFARRRPSAFRPDIGPGRHAIFERRALLPSALACDWLLPLLSRLLSAQSRSLSAGSGSWLIWPQDHRTLDGLMDYRTVQVCPGLGHLVQQPGCDEGDRAVRRQRVNPEPAVPLPFGPAGPGFAQDQILVVVAVVSRSRPIGAGPGPTAIGVQDAQPEGQVRVRVGARVAGRVEGACAPGELPVMHPRMDGELETVRVGLHAAHGHGQLIGADQEQSDGGKPGDYAVWPWCPGRPSAPLRRDVKEAHAITLIRQSAA
jgi:hypothetical protein